MTGSVLNRVMVASVLATICICCFAVRGDAAGRAGRDMDVPYLAPPERIQWWKDMSAPR